MAKRKTPTSNFHLLEPLCRRMDRQDLDPNSIEYINEMCAITIKSVLAVMPQTAEAERILRRPAPTFSVLNQHVRLLAARSDVNRIAAPDMEFWDIAMWPREKTVKKLSPFRRACLLDPEPKFDDIFKRRKRRLSIKDIQKAQRRKIREVEPIEPKRGVCGPSIVNEQIAMMKTRCKQLRSLLGLYLYKQAIVHGAELIFHMRHYELEGRRGFLALEYPEDFHDAFSNWVTAVSFHKQYLLFFDGIVGLWSMLNNQQFKVPPEFNFMEPYNILFDQMEEDFGLEKHDSDDEEEEKNYIDNLDEIKQTVLEFQGCYVYSDYKIDPRIREGLGKLTLGQISMLNAKRRAKVIVDPEGIRGVKDGCLTVNNLQTALIVAKDGDTIFLKPGVYEIIDATKVGKPAKGRIAGINKNLTIVGSSPKDTVIRGTLYISAKITIAMCKLEIGDFTGEDRWPQEVYWLNEGSLTVLDCNIAIAAFAGFVLCQRASRIILERCIIQSVGSLCCRIVHVQLKKKDPEVSKLCQTIEFRACRITDVYSVMTLFEPNTVIENLKIVMTSCVVRNVHDGLSVHVADGSSVDILLHNVELLMTQKVASFHSQGFSLIGSTSGYLEAIGVYVSGDHTDVKGFHGSFIRRLTLNEVTVEIDTGEEQFSLRETIGQGVEAINVDQLDMEACAFSNLRFGVRFRNDRLQGDRPNLINMELCRFDRCSIGVIVDDDRKPEAPMDTKPRIRLAVKKSHFGTCFYGVMNHIVESDLSLTLCRFRDVPKPILIHKGIVMSYHKTTRIIGNFYEYPMLESDSEPEDHINEEDETNGKQSNGHEVDGELPTIPEESPQEEAGANGISENGHENGTHPVESNDEPQPSENQQPPENPQDHAVSNGNGVAEENTVNGANGANGAAAGGEDEEEEGDRITEMLAKLSLKSNLPFRYAYEHDDFRIVNNEEVEAKLTAVILAMNQPELYPGLNFGEDPPNPAEVAAAAQQPELAAASNGQQQEVRAAAAQQPEVATASAASAEQQPEGTSAACEHNPEVGAASGEQQAEAVAAVDEPKPEVAAAAAASNAQEPEAGIGSRCTTS